MSTKADRLKEQRRRAAERRAAYVEAKISEIRKKAVDKLSAMVHETERKWEERTIGDVAALKIAEWTEAENRARKAAPVINQSFGVVYLPAPTTDANDWKARMEARKQAAIEAKEVPALPAKPDPEAA